MDVVHMRTCSALPGLNQTELERQVVGQRFPSHRIRLCVCVCVCARAQDEFSVIVRVRISVAIAINCVDIQN